MTYRLGKDLGDLGPGDRVEIPAGTVHGFKNPGDEVLILDVDVVFGPDGPTPETDPVPVAVTVARMLQEGRASRLMGYPPILQLAVVEATYPKGMREAGQPGVSMPSLAWLGRRLGYVHDPFAARTENP